MREIAKNGKNTQGKQTGARLTGKVLKTGRGRMMVKSDSKAVEDEKRGEEKAT